MRGEEKNGKSACLYLRAGAGKGMLLLAAVLLSARPASAAEATRVPKPVIEAGQGEKCVENTEFMRKNHMKLLSHQRDKTMHQGIRTKNHSLNGCIECHASRKNGSVVGSDQNFCQSCHSYVAAKLDCFECHSSKPRTPVSGQTGLGVK